MNRPHFGGGGFVVPECDAAGMHARADFRVDCLIDGHAQPLMIVAADEDDARAQVQRDWGRGARLQYRTPDDGSITVQWGNVAVLEVGAVELVRELGPQ